MKKKHSESKNMPDSKEKEENKIRKTSGNEPQEEVKKAGDSIEESPRGNDKSTEEKLKDELAEAKEKYLRLYSEFENYRRRTAREKLDMMQTASERLMVSLLPVLDDFRRAEQSSTGATEEEAAEEGIKLIATKFKKILEDEGIKEMNTSVGSAFDPEFHDAITQIPATKKKLKGKIVDTVERGYFLGEKVIRHAKVVIGA